jgi:hypothetical protein
VTKLEQVARAIMANISHDPDYEDCMRAARAAVEELREPTEAMIEAGRIAIVEYRENRREIMNSEFAELGYRSAIDAILNEKPDDA